ncbi:MAG: hypothetical protein WDZ65_04400, partial [Aquisalimonadaceae bacterium]
MATIRTLLFMLAGWVIWSSCFVALYAAVYLGCKYMEVPLDRISTLNTVLVVVWLAHAAVLVWVTMQSWRHWRAHERNRPPESRFTRTLALLLNA